MSEQFDEQRDRAEGMFDEVKGRGKEALGDLTNDEETRAQGKADEAKGKGKQAWSDVKDKAGDLKDKIDR